MARDREACAAREYGGRTRSLRLLSIRNGPAGEFTRGCQSARRMGTHAGRAAAPAENERQIGCRMTAVRTFRRRRMIVLASRVSGAGAEISSSRRSRQARHSTAEPRAIV